MPFIKDTKNVQLKNNKKDLSNDELHIDLQNDNSKKTLKLKYLITGASNTDTLHLKACPVSFF